MSIRKSVSLLLVIALLTCCFSATALAASYNARDVFEGNVSVENVIFKPGDKLSHGGNITVETHYYDVNDEEIGTGGDSIKAMTVDGKKCSEWVMTNRYGSVMQIGSMYRGAFAFIFKPVYAVADNEGYFKLIADTYASYIKDEEASNGKQIKLTGSVLEIRDGLIFVSVAENAIVALSQPDTLDFTAEVSMRVQAKGTIDSFADHGEARIPVVVCSEIVEMTYDPLQKGDSNDDVMKMKLRLQELGYYGPDVTFAHAEYNDACAQKVQQFQEKNGLPTTGTADAQTLSVMYSDSAVRN